MKRYNHNFEDGQIVRDLEYRETFKFSDRRDGFMAENNPGRLRLATAREIEEFQEDSTKNGKEVQNG